jgi:hypothetical protein
MKRSDIHSEFLSRFGSPEPRESVSSDALHAVEEKLQISFPDAYRTFIASIGTLATPDILGLMVDAHESDGPDIAGFDVARFFSPSEILETHTSYSGAGMDSSLVPVAIDSAGNVFGFRREDIASRRDDCSVWFFDHDFCKLEHEADSFDAWLEHYFPLKA